MTKSVLVPLPSNDFDPTETAVPWKILTMAGIQVAFATPDGGSARCDPRMLHGTGLGPLSLVLAATSDARDSYFQMSASEAFQKPQRWDALSAENYDALLLPGGHAKGIRPYLESSVLQACVRNFFQTNKPVGAICHGVVLAARSRTVQNHSVLYGRKTTALLTSQELTAWNLTRLWLGDYYRTYSQTVEAEVASQLAVPADFIRGPTPLLRDDPDHLQRGFVVQDGNYLSARWPGDAHLFGHTLVQMLRLY